jgi:hypothetical protein
VWSQRAGNEGGLLSEKYQKWKERKKKNYGNKIKNLVSEHGEVTVETRRQFRWMKNGMWKKKKMNKKGKRIIPKRKKPNVFLLRFVLLWSR